ncbi:hypothetical protein AYO20_11315 [Fonsecaea nubica]|uniref:Uncharacterized protein n=1 Tax=Fonsecaea nubica TaxID=856822 RepID=A0A178BXQ6_9EURO|nr:hypothetical protein AYO20_11315 [Fonsecaea nubica]OAL21672.1 hypothetical protein AYO20_11315 [Fonsecaea nubica]
MRRTTRSLIVNAILFWTVLFLIIYVNHDWTSTTKTFAWSRIHYKTSSSTLPEPRGSCPGLEEDSKPTLVVARVGAEDPSWLDTLAAVYHLCVYRTDLQDVTSWHLQVPANRGHEAMAYLTFLIDNYERLPAAGAVFVHGSRWAWHNDAPDYDNAALLASLNVSAALAPLGYHNLRCDWSASTCSPTEAPPQGSLETLARSVLEPWNLRLASDSALPRAIVDLFGGQGTDGKMSSTRLSLGRTDAIRSQCCAQFVVSRERMWQHSRDEYVALRQWLLDEGERAAHPDDRIAGRILSYIWHILFMPRDASAHVDLKQLNSLACPPAYECYCRLYGRCDLDGCSSPGHCRGQYVLPPGFRLPDDWAAKHS